MEYKDIKINSDNKRFFKLSEMIDVLEKRNLTVDCPEIFNTINYAHLMYKFSDFFYENPDNHYRYKDGTKLSDIYNLYLFFQKLSGTFFQMFHDVEQKFKRIVASLATELAKEEDAYSYLKETSYTFKETDTKSKKFLEKADNFLTKLKSIHEDFLKICEPKIKNKMENGVIPLWIFVDELTLGDLIKFVDYNNKFIGVCPYNKLKIDRKKMHLIKRFRDQIAHMNPIKPEIKFPTTKGVKTVRYSVLLNALNVLVPDLRDVMSKFYKNNKNLISHSIEKQIIKKYFWLNNKSLIEVV